MTNNELSTRYDATLFESKWYEIWEQRGSFTPESGSNKPKFTITIPPPNITGSLHMGHALCYSLQDMMGRYKKLRGYNVLILPGQDHAGIAAQSVVTKQLKKEGVNVLELGREKFTERIWQWRHESGDTILNQFRALGCAFDWSRLRFTLDDDYVHAVHKVFIDWHNKGLIYRGLRVVNWDPILQTSVSDIETERKTVKGKLYHIRYPFKDGSGEVVIATTRPETMLADVAVAVHPSDSRYEGKVGKTLVLPLVGREIPLISDQYPDPEFGTGAVKITPGHDPNDWEVGQRHGLEVLVVLDSKARVTHEGKYQGLDRVEARKQVVADLEEQGFLVKIDDHEIPILISSRSGEVVEPMASEQWFVRQTQLAAPAIEAIKSGEVKFVPERFGGIAVDWLENIRDWCISRQLWWGHRIPVYYTESGKSFAAFSWEEAQNLAGDEKIVRQEDDVLDTWFSSGLWPFATMGWPKETDDLATFFPTSLLVTARDIIYLWVSRMMMMSLDFTGKIPFGEVMIYATVLTEDGKRMSKSLGTGIDPIETINTKGADALRFALLSQTGANQDIRYGDKRSDDARGFCNKIWNASRFVLMNTGNVWPNEPSSLEIIDKWLLSRLKSTEEIVRGAYEAKDIQLAAQTLYHFFWSEVCDWYIEITKPRLEDPAKKDVPIWVLLKTLDCFLKMLHPIMPFITEEIHSHLPSEDNSNLLVELEWPDLSNFEVDRQAEAQVESWFEAVRAFRAMRAELGVNPREQIAAAYVEGSLEGGLEVFRSQAWVKEVISGRPEGAFISSSTGSFDLHLPTEGLIDPVKELARIDAEITKKAQEKQKIDDRLSNPQFVERAKPEVIERDRQAQEELAMLLVKLQERRTLFGG